MSDSYKRQQMVILSMALFLLTTRSFAIQCRAALGEHCTNYSDEYCKACPACPLGSGWDTTFKPRKMTKCGDIECYPCVNCPFGKYKLNSRTGLVYGSRRIQSQLCIQSQDKVQSMDVERPALPSPFNGEPNRKLVQGVMLTGSVFMSIGFIGVFCHFKRRKPGHAEFLPTPDVFTTNSSDDMESVNYEIDAVIGHTLPKMILDVQLSQAMTRDFYRGNI